MNARNLKLTGIFLFTVSIIGIACTADAAMATSHDKPRLLADSSIVVPTNACRAVTTDSRRMAAWRKARALYFRDLEFSEISPRFQHGFGPEEGLINARLYVDYLDTDDTVLRRPKAGRRDLLDVERNLGEALNEAPARDRSGIAKMEKSVSLFKSLPKAACSDVAAVEHTDIRKQERRFDKVIDQVAGETRGG